MSKQSKMRNGTAVAAQRRNAGPMRHRLQPRGGARNLQAELADDFDLIEDEHERRAATWSQWD